MDFICLYHINTEKWDEMFVYIKVAKNSRSKIDENNNQM